MTEYGIEKLLDQLEQYPDDDKLLAIIALYYIENPDGDKDLEYLEKAYQTNPSIENTHNLAFWSMYEHGEDERSLRLQKEILKQKPLSYYPYASYAQMIQSTMLFSKESTSFKSDDQAQEYIQCLMIATEKFYAAPISYQQRHLIHILQIYNNIAYAYKLLRDNKKASHYLMQVLKVQQDMNKSDWNNLNFEGLFKEEIDKVQLNLVRIFIAEKNNESAKKVLAEIVKNQSYSKLDVAVEYARLSEYQLVNEIIGDDVPNESWDWIWYALYHVDYDKWLRTRKALLKQERQLLEEWLVDVEQSLLKGDSDLYKSKCENIKDSEKVIAKVSLMLKMKNHPLPKACYQPDFENSFFGCLLFGCCEHGNLVNDNMATSV